MTPQLRHFEARASEGGSRERNANLSARLAKALNDSKHGETETTRQLLDDVHMDYAKLVASYDPAVQSHLGDLQEQIASLKQRLARLKSSASWRATRPLRKAGRFVMRMFRRNGARFPRARSVH